MNTSIDNDPIQAKLGAPGAGMPLLQRLFAKYILLPRMMKKESWDDANERFRTETEKLLKYVDGLDEEQLTTRVLVDPIKGLEDNSRYWSPLMCMEHLIITAPLMANTVVKLSQGVVPPGKVEIASFKPSGTTPAGEIRAKFAATMDMVRGQLREVRDRNSKTTFDHPWFGPFTAAQWNWLLGSHQGIHRNQVKAILKK